MDGPWRDLCRWRRAGGSLAIKIAVRRTDHAECCITYVPQADFHSVKADRA
ncbi:MAG: hypothetical protein RL591_1506 [Planctomycetota bacterium]